MTIELKTYDLFVAIVTRNYLLIKIVEVVKENNGRVAKWLTAPDLKSDILERVSWVRILPLPHIVSW